MLLFGIFILLAYTVLDLSTLDFGKLGEDSNERGDAGDRECPTFLPRRAFATAGDTVSGGRARARRVIASRQGVARNLNFRSPPRSVLPSSPSRSATSGSISTAPVAVRRPESTAPVVLWVGAVAAT